MHFFLFDKIRADAVESLVNDKGIDRDIAERAAGRVSLRALNAHVQESGDTVAVGALGDGKILQRIKDVLNWLSDPVNQAKISAIVQFFIQLAMVFVKLMGG